MNDGARSQAGRLQAALRHDVEHGFPVGDQVIGDDAAMAELSVSSKLSPDWDFLCRLRDRGRVTAAHWLTHHFDDLGERSTVDLKREFLEARP